MPKGQDSKKDDKTKPARTAKEKKQVKKDKKQDKEDELRKRLITQS